MDEKSKESIELEVRRFLATHEPENRKLIVEELNSHRSYLQTQLRNIGWVITAIFAIVVAAAAFLFGKTSDEIVKKIDRVVESKVIEYRIVDIYKQKLISICYRRYITS